MSEEMSDGVIRARDVKAKPVTWLWRERIPRGMITVVVGWPDKGKGLLCVLLAAELSQQGMNVLYSPIEDSHAEMTRPRLEAAGADLSRVLLKENELFLPAQMAELSEIVRRRKIDLLIIDPFSGHLSTGVSKYSDSIRRVLTPLKRLAEETGMGVVVVEHALKNPPKSGNPLALIPGGSSGLAPASRMAFAFGVDPDDEDGRLLCHLKGNIRDRPPALRFDIDLAEVEGVGSLPFLVYDTETKFDAMRLFERNGSGPGRPADKRDQASNWLANYLFAAGHPVRGGKVIEDAKEQQQITAKTLRRAADDMGIVRSAAGGRNCTWTLPEEKAQEMRQRAVDAASEAPEDPPPTEGLANVDALLDSILGEAKTDDGDQPDPA